MTWSIFTVSHFYKLAVKGDFKKSELEADEYLCSSVTHALDSGDNRIDKAIALYLADEISEDCLSSEADFVLWTPSDLEKSWAYLAKGLLKKYDSEQFEAYLQKACDVDENGPACDLAQYQADPLHHQIPVGSETGRILQVVQDFETAHYAKAEKMFQSLGRVSGFETFSRQGVVKSLWAQNQIEKSKGAYLNVIHQLVPSQKRELSAWICHEELDRGCTQAAIEACEDLKDEFKEDIEPIQDSFVALALIREKECRHTSTVEYFQFQDLLQERKDLAQFVLAIAENSKLTPEKRADLLKNLSFRKEPVRPQFIRLQAIQKWVSETKGNEDFQVLVTFLKEKKVQDLSWIKIYKKTLDHLMRAQADKHVKAIIDLPSPELIATYNLETDQLRGQYFAKNFEKAYQQWKSLKIDSVQGRRPASAEASLADIEADLKKRFEKDRP